jgi:hypothetical protein
MSTSTTRYPNHHRSAPVREAVALWYQTLVYCSLPRREILRSRFDMSYLDDVMVRQFGLIVIHNDRVITQIPIDRRLL